MTDIDTAVSAVRAFSRFYTGSIGALDSGHLDTPFSLSEARTIYEVATRERTTAAEIARAMSVDPAQMSRIISRLRQAGVIQLDADTRDRRQSMITLTEEGRAAFATLNEATIRRVARLVAPIEAERRASLVAALSTVRTLLGDAVPAAPLVLRPHRIGELGWLIHRQGLLYNQQYGWNIEFEALIARLYHDFEKAPDTPPKGLWIAERNGAVAAPAVSGDETGVDVLDRRLRVERDQRVLERVGADAGHDVGRDEAQGIAHGQLAAPHLGDEIVGGQPTLGVGVGECGQARLPDEVRLGRPHGGDVHLAAADDRHGHADGPVSVR